MKKLIPFLLIALIFVACNGGSNSDETISESPTESFVAETVEEQLDVDTVVLAVRTMDKDLCDTVTNSEQKEDCHTKVDDSIIMSTASTMSDCEKIKEKNTAKKCEILVQNILDKIELESERAAEKEKISEIVEAGDIGACDLLKQEHFNSQCTMGIYMNQAAENMDAAPCENIENAAVKNACIENVQLLLEEYKESDL